MIRVFEIDPAHLHEAEPGLAAAEQSLAGAELVVFPTETVYGLGSRPDDPDATDRLFRAKQRPLDLNIPLLVDSAVAAWEVAEPSPAARALATRFWPGPLTLVLPRTKRSRPWQLGKAADTVAVRVPDHPLCLALLARTGHLAATSANLSGRPPLSDRTALVDTFGDAVAVYLVLPAGLVPASGSPSTVVDLTAERMRILRPGPIPPERIEAVAGRH